MELGWINRAARTAFIGETVPAGRLLKGKGSDLDGLLGHLSSLHRSL